MSAPNEDRLPDVESFDDDHLSEAAVVLLADGATSLVSARVAEHGAECAACASRVGEAAIASAEVHSAFVALAEHPVAAQAADPVGVPVVSRALGPAQLEEGPAARTRGLRGQAGWAIGSGLAVAALASAPTLAGLARGISELRHGLEVLITVSLQLEQALRLASGRLETVRMGVSWVATFALVTVGVWIARRKPRAAADETNEVVA